MEFLSKSRSSSVLKKPVKAQHGHSSSMQLSNDLYVGSGNTRNNNPSYGTRNDERSFQNFFETKVQTKNNFHKKSLSVAPERTFFAIKSRKNLSNYENLGVLGNTKHRDESPLQLSERHPNQDLRSRNNYQYEPKRSMGSLNAYQNEQQRIIIVHRVGAHQSSNRNDPYFNRDNPLISTVDNAKREGLGGQIMRMSSEIRLPQIEQEKQKVSSKSISQINESKPIHDNRFMDRNHGKNSGDKAKSLDRFEIGQSKNTSGSATRLSIENLKVKVNPQQLLTQTRMINSENRKENSHADYKSGIQNANLSKRGNLADSKKIEEFMAENGGFSANADLNRGIRSQNFEKTNPLATADTVKLKGRSSLFNVISKANNNIVVEFCFKTQAGALPEKPVKTNQDSYIILEKYSGDEKNFFFAVCDGHGSNGHHASAFVKQNLPQNIDNNLKFCDFRDDASLRSAISRGFLQTNKDLVNSSIDVNFSGSTTVALLLLNNQLISANVGDSRAIMAKFKRNQWEAFPLSIDHKPDDKREMQRIIAKGGRVEAYRDLNGDPVGPARVWLKNNNIPGLAMARSLGDSVAGQVGVIAEPEILNWNVQEEDRFMVIASDGIWEFLSNEQVMNCVVPFYLNQQLEAACDKLVYEATARWKEVKSKFLRTNRLIEHLIELPRKMK